MKIERVVLIWRVFVALFVALASLGLIGGFLGRFFPLGDSLAVIRPLSVVAVLFGSVLASMAGLRILSFATTLLALLCGLQIFLAVSIKGPPGTMLVYQKNMLFRTDDLAGLEADIRAADPVAVTLQEVSEPNLALLAALKDRYPSQQVCPGENVGGEAVASRLPIVEGTGFCAPGLAAMQVQGERAPVWIVSIHLHWPYPYRQAAQVEVLLPVLEKLEGQVIIGGDFNMVVWGSSVKRIGEATGTEAAGPTLGTYTGFDPWPSLPIDHVLAPGGGQASLRPAFGSDHLGVLASVMP